MLDESIDLAARHSAESSSPIGQLKIKKGFWYVATPYSNFPDGLEAAWISASEATGRLIQRRIPVYSPIAHSHPISIFGDVDAKNHDIWIPANEPLMDAAHGLLVLMLPSWKRSYGISLEIEFFLKAEKPIVYLDPEML